MLHPKVEAPSSDHLNDRFIPVDCVDAKVLAADQYSDITKLCGSDCHVPLNLCFVIERDLVFGGDLPLDDLCFLRKSPVFSHQGIRSLAFEQGVCCQHQFLDVPD